jgi:hypothetical protein
MEEAAENGKELSHTAHANGMNAVCVMFTGKGCGCFTS